MSEMSVLTLFRIWYSAITGKIAPKDVAADWAIKRLPASQPVFYLKLSKLIWDKKKITWPHAQIAGRIYSL